MSKSLYIFTDRPGIYLKSTNFIHTQFLDKEQAFHFLNQYTGNAPLVFRLNFESMNNETTATQSCLHDLYFVDIFELKEFEKISSDNLMAEENDDITLENLRPLLSKEETCTRIQIIKDKIATGHFYQVNYSIPLTGTISTKKLPLDTEQLFLKMRNDFAGDFHAFLPLINKKGEEKSFLSFSPELFIKISHQEISTSPIKGTIGLGREQELLSSVKEEAELSMIVDLLRNDLNAVCDQPVSVLEHRKLLTLKNLTHTYSTIIGKTTKNLGDLLKLMLPGGSISGCPKKEAVQTIYALEPFAREHYTGVLGLFHQNHLISSIVIRTAIIDHERNLFYNAGSGIVYDSSPIDEYEEILLKSKSLMKNSAFLKESGD